MPMLPAMTLAEGVTSVEYTHLSSTTAAAHISRVWFLVGGVEYAFCTAKL